MPLNHIKKRKEKKEKNIVYIKRIKRREIKGLIKGR